MRNFANQLFHGSHSATTEHLCKARSCATAASPCLWQQEQIPAICQFMANPGDTSPVFTSRRII